MKSKSPLNMKIIGVVGQIAAGKTTVVSMLEEMLDAYVINVDKVGHKVLKKDHFGYNPAVNLFGEEIIGQDGEIDRKILGDIVFSDPAKLKQLNSISHPLIYNSVKREIEAVREDGKYNYIVVDAALLIEIKLVELVDEIWGVYIDPQEQIKRVMSRNNISKKDAKQRISYQLDWDVIAKHIDVKINNSKDLNCTKKQVMSIF